MDSYAAKPIFSNSSSEVYAQYMVPLFFASYAADMVKRIAALAPSHLLEIAAGTGVVTRALVQALPERTQIVATDLSQPMLDRAAEQPTARPVTWRQADAMALPFEDGSFDTVVCQFGVMLFPDRAKAFAEARRVLRPSGAFVFSVWGRIEENQIVLAVRQPVAELLTGSPNGLPAGLAHSYSDHRVIERDLVAGGFTNAPEWVTVPLQCRADSPRAVATALCGVSPLCNEIETRDPAGLQRAIDAATPALTGRFGSGPFAVPMQAHVISVRR